VPGDIHELANRLARRETRAKQASRIAHEVGAEALFILLHDPEIGALISAPGFPQTLPGGPLWRAFLKKQPAAGSTSTLQLPFPDQDTLKPAQCFACGSVVFLFIGGESRLPIERFADAPLLPALLEAEAAQLASKGLVQAAREATERATNLAGALDGARAEVGRKAVELSAALSRTDRLNRELSQLNQTLEQRVESEIRERMQVEEALRQAQKMEAIGQLTGGVAHDFNNLLTVIMGSLDSIRRLLDDPADELNIARLRRLQNMAFQGAERASTLTSRLLAFARRQPLKPESVDVNKLATGLTDLLQRTLGERIALETVSTPGLWLAKADRAELESALINVAINARDAMPDGGKLTIETANTWLDEEYVRTLAEPVPPGQYVMLAVADTGHGMDRQTLDRVFEPFFTTKGVGKGTGLGLSQVYGFVRQSEGHVRVYSEPGAGTTIKLYLPRDADPDAKISMPQLETVADGGSETILVVEDHDGLREYSTSVLRELGYQVLEASEGGEALQLLKKQQDVRLLFTDVVLPGLNGRQLADEALLLRPDLKVLFTTGYTRNAIVHNGRLDQGVDLIGKPFTFAALAAKVRQILDR
jgi:signal transduction histidine kinase/CheY-like chemotaxis protein